ncbi:hypothetical protein BJY18_004138 [Amycolatopsis jiangsuensis]|uniref:Uncharacterized protein n=1 Tax=Amycolatopsis jiangsuensis TaxID=1181879 RepID=A0A840IY77_9PSEU|nr:hypothetical protein [Amycolatopsis jiangsuensis]
MARPCTRGELPGRFSCSVGPGSLPGPEDARVPATLPGRLGSVLAWLGSCLWGRSSAGFVRSRVLVFRRRCLGGLGLFGVARFCFRRRLLDRLLCVRGLASLLCSGLARGPAELLGRFVCSAAGSVVFRGDSSGGFRASKPRLFLSSGITRRPGRFPSVRGRARFCPEEMPARPAFGRSGIGSATQLRSRDWDRSWGRLEPRSDSGGLRRSRLAVWRTRSRAGVRLRWRGRRRREARWVAR